MATNEALPKATANLLRHHVNNCQNLGLIMDKFVPWGSIGRGQWDLVAKAKPPNKKKNAEQKKGGEAKGHWLKSQQRIYDDETDTLFIDRRNNPIERADVTLLAHKKRRWRGMVRDGAGIAFEMTLSERMAAGLGASNILETGLTLERNTGFPYLPGSTVKGLARAWGLIQVAGNLGIRLTEESRPFQPLSKLAKILIETEQKDLDKEINTLLDTLKELDTSSVNSPSEDAGLFVDYFRLMFGSQHAAGAIAFTDAIYYGEVAPVYATDVMTPHYVTYYTGNGDTPPSDDENPTPVSFLAVDKGNTFAFGLLPRRGAFTTVDVPTMEVLETGKSWLVAALTQLGAGSKTAAGYGFFRGKSMDEISLNQ